MVVSITPRGVDGLGCTVYLQAELSKEARATAALLARAEMLVRSKEVGV
jgi:hypothetical protein